MRRLFLTITLLVPFFASGIDLTAEDRKILMILTLFHNNKEMIYNIGLSDEGAKAVEKHIDQEMGKIKERMLKNKDEICLKKDELRTDAVALSDEMTAKTEKTKEVQKGVADLTKVLGAQDRATLDAWIAETTEFNIAEGAPVDPLKEGTVSAEFVINRMCGSDQ
jgi:hypothetical protein